MKRIGTKAFIKTNKKLGNASFLILFYKEGVGRSECEPFGEKRGLRLCMASLEKHGFNSKISCYICTLNTVIR